MFLTGLGIFTASSFASAMAGTAASLFAARAGQGLGAAMLSPAALAIIMSAFHGTHRAKALAAWGAVGGAGAALGVLVGGVLTEFTDWRMIFYVNLPVAAMLAIAALKIIPADTRKPRWKGLDVRALSSRRRVSARSSSRSHRPGRRLDIAPDTSLRPRWARRPRGLRGPRAPHRCTAPADRATGRSCCRRRALPDARRRRLDLGCSCSARSTSRTCSAGPADDWTRLHPARARGRRRRARLQSHRRQARRPQPSRRRLPGRGGRYGPARSRRRERQLPPRRPTRNARRRTRARRRRRLRLDRHPHRHPGRGVGDDLRPQLDRRRDRRHGRDRDLLHDRGRERRRRRPSGSSRDRARVRRSRAPRCHRQPGRSGRPAAARHSCRSCG